jgi:hypothetical protein
VAFVQARESTCFDCSQQELDLWVINSDGTDERLLVSAEDLDTMAPGDARAAPHQFEWVPGRNQLAFNTHLQMAFGSALNNDLHRVDASTGEWSTLLPAGEGGGFYYSPDGSQIAVVTGGEIDLVDAEGRQRERVLTYTPVNTGSEYQFYARPVWASDGHALRVAIPPPVPHAQPAEQTTV